MHTRSSNYLRPSNFKKKYLSHINSQIHGRVNELYKLRQGCRSQKHTSIFKSLFFPNIFFFFLLCDLNTGTCAVLVDVIVNLNTIYKYS